MYAEKSGTSLAENTVFPENAFTNKYSVYSLNLNNGNVSQNTFVDENFMTNSFSVTDNRIYYIKTDSLKSYVACRDFSSDKKSKITFSDNVNEVFNNNGKSYARLCDGSIYKLSQSSSTYVADTGEFKNIYNAGINRAFCFFGCFQIKSIIQGIMFQMPQPKMFRYLTEKYILP